jgi:uncharacterized protein YutE (UPF0331/DUF86 family)
MADPDIIYAKIGNIQNCLRRIRQVTNLDPAALDGFDAQDIFVLNLQRAVQAAIDLAAHIVASEELGLPDSLRANFTLLEHAGILEPRLAGCQNGSHGRLPQHRRSQLPKAGH